MKRLLFLTLLMLAFYQSNAQMDTSKRHEISLNTHILQSILGDNENIQQPYTVTYKWKYNQQNAIRLGIGGAFNQDKTQIDGFADSETRLSYAMDVRAGYERRIVFKKMKGFVYFGGDVAFNLEANELIVDSGFDKVSTIDRSWGAGLGPILGVQYYLTPRLSISTEGAFYFFYNKKTEAQLFENFPNFDDVINQVQGLELQQILPASIYLNYTF